MEERGVFKQPLSFPSCLKWGALGFQSCNPAVSLQPSLPACSALSSQSPEKKTKKKDMRMTAVSYNINASLSDPVSISNVSNNLPLIVFLSCGTHSSCSYCLYNAAKQHVILRLSCVDQAPLFFLLFFPHFLSHCLYFLFPALVSLSAVFVLSSLLPLPLPVIIPCDNKNTVLVAIAGGEEKEKGLLFRPACWHAYRTARSDPCRCLHHRELLRLCCAE